MYDGHWSLWTSFLLNDAEGTDPYLTNASEATKSALIGLFLYRRYQSGARGKAATSVTAGIRMRFAQRLMSTDFLDAAIIHSAREACRLNPSELRAKRDALTAPTSVKLPVCESIITSMRTRLWVETPWAPNDLPGCMAYIGCAWGYDQSARVSEYTKAEGAAQDHCARVDDLTFILMTGDRVVGSSLRSNLPRCSDDTPLWSAVIECRALGASTKGKVVTKAKLIAQRSTEEAQFLHDLARFVSLSGSLPGDELFSYRTASGSKSTLRAKTIRQELKTQCSLAGLPPDYFSSHSLRKGAITHMRATGASEDDRRDRGGYAPNSQLMHSTYDYATGLGPLASSGLSNAVAPGVVDVLRLLPARR